MEFDVFISYHTRSSKHITEAVCNALENQKIKCWYAPRNIEGNYAKSIVESINKCRVFLLILNKEASYSEDVLNEINLVVERVRKGEDIAIIPFHTSEEDISPDAKYYLGRIHWVDAVNPPLEKRINELVSRISYILDKKQNLDSNNNSNEFRLKSNFLLPSENFIGRNDELIQLTELLNKYGKVFVKGMGGIGKSEFVKKFINDNKDNYDTVIYSVYENSLIETFTREDFFNIENFKRKTLENGKIEDNETYFKRKIEKINELANEKTLIVIDNFEVFEDEKLKDILNGNYHLIIITRNDFKQYKLPIIELNAITNKQELVDIFKKFYLLNLKEEDISVVEQIIDLIGNHTLTIQLLAAVMQEMRIKPTKIYEEIKNNGIHGNLQVEVVHNMQNYDSIFQCLSILFKLSDLNTEEKNVLKLLTLFPTSGVEFETFMELCDLENGLVINKLIKKNYILHDYSSDYISIHPLISDLIINEFPLSLDETNLLIKNLQNKYSWNITKQDLDKYLPIVYSVCSKITKFEPDSALSFMRFADFMIKNGDLKNAENVLNRAIDILENDSEKYWLELISIYNDAGYIQYLKGNIEKNLEYNNKIIELLSDKEDNQSKIKRAFTLKTIAIQYIDIQDFNLAKNYIEDAYKNLLNNPDSTDLDIGSCYYVFARLYNKSKDFEKAYEFATKSYDCFIGFYGKDNIDTTSSLKIKGEISISLGKIEEGILLLEKAVEVREKYCKENDISLLKAKEALCDGYIQNGNLEKAKEELDKIYSIMKEHFICSENRLKQIEDKIKICEK